MHPASHGHPDPDWVRWAEAESVRRLKMSLQEIKVRKRAEAIEQMDPSLSGWDPDQPPSSEPEVQIVLTPPPPPARIIRVHSENLLDA